MRKQVLFHSNVSDTTGGSILSTELIDRAGRSRLRAAGAYNDYGSWDDSDWRSYVGTRDFSDLVDVCMVMSVNENDNGAFSIEAYLEMNYDSYYDSNVTSTTLWEGVKVGIHLGDPAIVLQAVDDLVDQLIAEFLDDE